VKEENNQKYKHQRYEAMWEREPSFSDCVEEASQFLRPEKNL
jgi:hypothetical protein